ncbi:MAG TPA: 30S ribosomal protein S20 [Kiritimatiellia bacterium]|mgnify:CR=1 FL=1|nr:30S ribosomal protein S20 [Kiritimatiellia bacterium]HNR93998.1 30S ribosomal protein S20 [Kiritimatiellia bacterium]HPA77442.1 30S ribosomal protein S20 [Kiritimatiellia bacterium]HQQ04386.1 30S ribosomal protein S20 [Kiritimatiellia bacterium]
MPNNKSAEKRLRQSVEARQRNQSVKTRVKNTRRKFFESFEVAEGADPQAVYKKYCSELDKAAKKGVISRNTAQRRKTRAANRIRVKKAS